MIGLIRTLVTIISSAVHGEWLMAIRRCRKQRRYGRYSECEFCKLVVPVSKGFVFIPYCEICICSNYKKTRSIPTSQCTEVVRIVNGFDEREHIDWEDKESVWRALDSLETFVINSWVGGD